MAILFDDANSQRFDQVSTAVTVEPLTMAQWINRDSDTVNDYNFQQLSDINGTPDDQQHWRLCSADASTGGTNFAVAAIIGPGTATTDTANTSGTTSLNTWHHVGGKHTTNSSRHAYLDGTESTENTEIVSTPAGVDEWSVGWENDSTPGDGMSGSIFWPALWSVALAAADLTALSDGAPPWSIRPAALAHFAEYAAVGTGNTQTDMVRQEAMVYGGTGSPSTVEGPCVCAGGSVIIVVHAELSGPVITDVDTDEAWNDGDTGLVITGTGFV